MRPLPHQFSADGFAYEQIRRYGQYALYQQTRRDTPPMCPIHYEVVRIRQAAAHTWPNGKTTPAREVYPTSRAWGRDGWTFGTLAAAEAALTTLSDSHRRPDDAATPD